MVNSRLEPLDGYDVFVEGERIGIVVGVSRESIVIRQGVLIRSFRAVPMSAAVVRDAERSVTVFVSRAAVRRSPKINRNQAVDDALIAAHYEAAALVEGALDEDWRSTQRDRWYP